jgi:hypothetical protein
MIIRGAVNYLVHLLSGILIGLLLVAILPRPARGASVGAVGRREPEPPAAGDDELAEGERQPS